MVAPKIVSKPPFSTCKLVLPFPSRFRNAKKQYHEKKIVDTFLKVQFNKPLLDVIKKVLKYAKFLKELCTTKCKLKSYKVVSVRKNVFVMLQRKLPPKCYNLGSFTISIKRGNSRLETIMPY